MSEGGLYHVQRGLVAVGQRGDDGGILASGFGEKPTVGILLEDAHSGFSAAREDHRVNAGVRGQCLGDLVVLAGHELQHVLRNARFPEAAQRLPRHGRSKGRGLEQHRVSRCQRCRHAAHWNRHGEVPRRNHQHRAQRSRLHIAGLEQGPQGAWIVFHKVNRLGHLRVGLVKELATHGCGGADQFAPVLAESRRRIREPLVTAFQPQCLPFRLSLASLADHVRHVLFDGKRDFVNPLRTFPAEVAIDLRGALAPPPALEGIDGPRREIGTCPLRTYRLRPLAACRQGPVGVGLVLKGHRAVHRNRLGVRIGFGGAVLLAARLIIELADFCEGVAETLLIFPEARTGFVQIEEAAEEVFRTSVFVEPPHEVGDRARESGTLDHRGVEQGQEAALAGLGVENALEVRAHALQHFERDALPEFTVLQQVQREGDIEEIVGCHTDVNRVQRFRGEGIQQHLLEVRIHQSFRRQHRVRPTLQCGFQSLHREVRTLDDAHLDGCPPGFATGLRPLLQTLQPEPRIRQVRLQHDSGGKFPEPRLVEALHERLGSQFKIVVRLHVEVHELRGALGGAMLEAGIVKLAKPLVDFLEAFREGERVQLGVDAGDLDGDVVKVRIGEVAQVLAQPPLCLVLAQHRLAEVIEVDALAGFASPGEVPSEGRTLGGNNVLSRVEARLEAHQRSRQRRHPRPDPEEDLQKQAIQRGKGLRDAPHF